SNYPYVQIIPDGVVWKLNFAALAKEHDGEVIYFGGNKHLVFNYYAEVSKQARPESSQVLAFSFNEEESATATRNYSLLRDLGENIPGTSKEISSISTLFDGEYYFGSQATESRFKQKAKHFNVLHLAIHGFQNETYPENSYLQFSDKDDENDGRLHAFELYNEKIHAQLAIITACNSGRGKIVTGEGMVSLAHSFAYAGTESMLVSRWEVPDISTPYLIRYFYMGLAQGMRKSEALRFAQSEYLKNDADNITSAPFYWAGLYVLGNDRPIEFASRSPMETIVGVGFGLVVLSLLGFFSYRRKMGHNR
ncbi:MAG: CHAT domain-containing protein, partial [Bacteroidota bacterium]